MRGTNRNLMMTIVLTGLTVAVLGCSSATPTDTPGIDRLGKYILRQEGPEVDVVLGYKYAAIKSLGDEWLILEIAVTSPASTSAEIRRENIWVETPGGEKIPLATQRTFGEAYRTIRNTIEAAKIARDPMDYFLPSRRPCRVQFFVPPGAGVAYDAVSVNDRRACEGRLYFKIPGGIEQGRWVLGMDLENSTVRIPFTL